jgi:FMN phosphatase YigB (HAD superfamily)
VLKRLEISQFFEGIVHKPKGTLLGKTQKTLYDVAMLAADVQDPADCYFIDDGLANVFMALNCGWNAVLLHHRDFHQPLDVIYDDFRERVNRIATIKHLPYVFEELF